MSEFTLDIHDIRVAGSKIVPGPVLKLADVSTPLSPLPARPSPATLLMLWEPVALFPKQQVAPVGAVPLCSSPLTLYYSRYSAVTILRPGTTT